MNITPKTLLILGVASILLISALAVVSRFSVLAGFADIETENARVNGIRVLNAIDDNLATLIATTGDWAPWDDAYQFVEDLNQAFIAQNLTQSTLTNIRVSFMVFIGRSGQILFSAWLDPATGKLEQEPAGLGTEILKIPNIVLSKDLLPGWSGILKTDQGIVLAASRPIVKSDLSGPARGTLVLGRYFDDKELQRINKTTKLDTRMYDWADRSLPKDCLTAQLLLSSAHPVYVTALGKEQIATYLMLADVSGNPAAILKVQTDRNIYQTGLKTWWYYVASMIAIGLLFTFMIMAVLHQIVLAPLSRLNRNVQSIGNARSPVARLPVHAQDELGQLAVEINRMLGELAAAGKRLSEQSYQSGLSLMASDMLHQIRNSLSPITAGIGLAEKSLMLDSLQRIDQALDELETESSSQHRRNDLLQFIRIAAARLGKMLADIGNHLDQTREPIAGIENILQEYQLTAEIRPQIVSIDLSELIDDALEEIRSAGAWTVHVTVDKGLSKVGPGLGNRVSLLHVVKTLLSAFARLIKDQNHEIHITATQISGEKPTRVLLSFTTTGAELEQEVLDTIFERGFFSRQEDVPGISLHWCANVVNAMGGQLRAVNKEKGTGAGFCLTLPMAESIYMFEEETTDGN